MTTGVYDSPLRGKQLIRFDDMNLGKVCYTDFDAVLEWKDRAWLLFEVKKGSKDVPVGQRLALERFIQDVGAAGKLGCAAIVEHNVRNPYEDIYLRDCFVRSIFMTNELAWRPTKRLMNSKELMLDFFVYMQSHY